MTEEAKKKEEEKNEEKKTKKMWTINNKAPTFISRSQKDFNR